MPLDVEELEPTTRNDYRRANGAPMVVIDGRNERYSRPSSFAKPLDDESALVNWKIDRAAIGVAYDRALQAAYVAIAEGDRDGLKELREKAIAAGRGAEKADIGTALHAMSVRWEQGEAGFFPPEPFASSLVAYSAELRRLMLESVRYEFHTVNRQYRCAGTADRLYRACSPLVTPNGEILPVGSLLVGDLKTGEKLEYSKPAYAVQLALYAEGQMYDVLTDEFIETPPINRDWAIIVHMPADQPGLCELLWVDLEVGRWGAYLVDQIKTWRKMWRSGEFGLPPVMLDTNLVNAWNAGAPAWSEAHDPEATIATEPAAVQPPIAAANGGGLTPSAVGPFDNAEELAGHIEWAKERLAGVAQHPGAKQALLIRWPAGLPTPKQGIETLEQARDVHFLLDMIEADYQLGFVPKPAAIVGSGPSTRKGRRK